MAETPEQYKQRIRTHLVGKDPLAVLEATPERLVGLVQGKPEVLLRKRPTPEKWSVVEVLAHLAEVELVIGFRVRLMLGSSGVTIQGFDQDAWATRYSEYPLAEALEMQRVVRAANLALYRSLSAEQWEYFGMHTERGKETVRDLMQLHAGHDLNHLEQIEKMVTGLKAA